MTFFDPLDPRSLADGIERALADIGRSHEARERRRLQAKTFDWSASAKIVARRLREVS